MKHACTLIAGAFCAVLFARSESTIEYRYLDELASLKTLDLPSAR